MKNVPLGLQLYTVREALQKDHVATLERVAGMQFAGVETAGVFGDGAEYVGRLLGDLGLKVLAAHGGMPIGEDAQAIFDEARALGTDTLVCSLPDSRFTSLESVDGVIEELTRAHENARAHHFRFLYHNHWYEFGRIEGQTHFDRLVAGLPADFEFELDIYWAAVGGEDPAGLLDRLGRRAKLIHIKDGPIKQDDPGHDMLALGTGSLDIPGIVRHATDPEWLIVELDRCATDMLEAVEHSASHMLQEGLGHGITT